MDDFTEFQLKEYENISQAHFKTNEVLATFYRYFLIITAIPITTVGLAIINMTDKGIDDEARALALFLFSVTTILLSIVGVAVILYIEGLRLDAILYARVVNSIRQYFFRKDGAESFGTPVLPTDHHKPSFGGFGASFVIYHACALMNTAYFALGVLAMQVDRTASFADVTVTSRQWGIVAAAALFIFGLQIVLRQVLVHEKTKKGI